MITFNEYKRNNPQHCLAAMKLILLSDTPTLTYDDIEQGIMQTVEQYNFNLKALEDALLEY